MAVKGPLGRSGASVETFEVLEGVREVWKCARRVCVVCVREMSFWMSFGGGMVVGGYCAQLEKHFWEEGKRR